MPLSYAAPGEESVIHRIGGSPEVKKHLENLGFVVGGSVKVITALNGNVIVETSNYVLTSKRGDRVSYPLTLAEGEYFILSDNRENGVDSRYFGTVTKDEILGTVITLIRRNKL